MLATAINDVTSGYILGFVLKELPSEVCAFRSSLGYEIVARLSCFLSQSFRSDGRPEGLDYRCHQTQMAPTILEDLSTLLQSGFFEEAKLDARSNRKTKHKSKRSRRKATTDPHAELKDRLFQVLGSQVPRTRESAEEMIKSILDNQKDTLKVSTLLSNMVHWHSKALLTFQPVLFQPTSMPGNKNTRP